ncbi:hypothetical protein FHR70_000722 [Microvirga lupini]|uniref:Uncharacterized protein n=1 Tax=Microvirga lupini TaxID=420324 RepID=A0A7W4VID5_9HYPH|nr:hypothetical protein [Microvirga lupini]MBB3017682.1 hypothetical protein [Microvirga lupini]
MNVVSRAEAREQGLKRYFTGAPCKRGHIDERFTASTRCVSCNAIICAGWKAGNKDLKDELDREYRSNNRERQKKNSSDWYSRNRDLTIERARQHAQKSPEAQAKKKREWKFRNPDSSTFHSALRRARKSAAMPAWFGELDEFVWDEAAELAILRRAATDISWAADHMIPLACKKACGLHVWNNCQVIPAYLNGRKGNKLILTEPDEWLARISK